MSPSERSTRWRLLRRVRNLVGLASLLAGSLHASDVNYRLQDEQVENVEKVATYEPQVVIVADVKVRDAKWALRYATADGDLVEQLRALLAYRSFDERLVVEELLKYLRVAHPALRPHVREVLSGLRRDETVGMLVADGLGHRNALVREHVALALADGAPLARTQARRALADLVGDRHAPVRAAAILACGKLGVVEALDSVMLADGDPEIVVRMRVPECVARLAGERSVNFVERFLQDPDWRVRARAARALGQLPCRRSVRALADRLRVETGRVRDDIVMSLEGITGRDFGLDAQAWTRLSLLSEAAQRMDRSDCGEPSRSTEAPATPSDPRYFGLPVVSERFTILIDSSFSMVSLMEKEGPLTPLGVDPETRMDRAKREVTELLNRVSVNSRFGIVWFAELAYPWRDDLEPALPSLVRRASDEVARRHASGKTSYVAGLAWVFDQAERELRRGPIMTDRTPDTIYLVSDGRPNVGVKQWDLVVSYVRERNRDLDLQIHCIGLAEETGSLLRELARVGRGHFVKLYR